LMDLLMNDFPHMWIMAQNKNMFNCMDMLHGLPLLRLARYGFMSVPLPTDFGGLLNANALYSFTTGIPQLIISILIAAMDVAPLDATILLPLGISSASLVLSLANVLFNFPGTLAEVEGERAQLQRLNATLDMELREKVVAKERWFAEEQKKIEGACGPNLGPAEQLERKTKMQNLTNALREERCALEETQASRKRDEVLFFRSHLAEAKAALSMNQKHVNVRLGSGGDMEKMRKELEPWEEAMKKLEADKENQVRNLDFGQDDVYEKVAEMDKTFKKKQDLISDQIKLIKQKYTYDAIKP